MRYEVTATRKRPQLFDSLVGQEFVVSTIKNAIEQKRFAHAYLFSGPRGVGKTSSARILAKALNCVEGPTAYPCGVCTNCTEITHGNSTDVIEIDGASNTSVNDIRVIKDEVLFPPQSSRYKIYIIDEVHMLSTSAFNALLKTIEEPPSYVIFIFATTETQKVPATIRSRCQQFHFQLIPLNTIKEMLIEATKEMGVEAEDEALFWIAKESTGSMRDAYTLFDQVLSFSGPLITMAQIEEKLGLAGLDKLSAIIEPLAQENSSDSLAALTTLLESGVSVEQAIKDLAQYMRSLLLIKRGITSENTLGIQLSQIPSTIIETYSEEQLEAALELFLSLYREIRFSLSPRFELELAISRLAHLHQMSSSSQLVKKIESLQQQLLSGELPPPPIQREKKETISPPAPEKRVEKKSVDKALLLELVQSLATKKDQLGLILGQVVAIDEKEGKLHLHFSSTYAFDSAKQHEKELYTLFAQRTGFDGRLLIEKIESESKGEKQIKQDTLTESVTSLFRGEIIEQM